MKYIILSILLLLGASRTAFSQSDAEDCTEHPLFKNRIPNYYIEKCEFAEYGEMEVPDKNMELRVEGGKKWTFWYRMPPGKKGGSGESIRKNYMDAIKAKGGTLITSENAVGYAVWKTGGTEIFLSIAGWIGDGDYSNSELYVLTIVEKSQMAQVIEANTLSDDLKTTGKAVLYIQFETGRATIMPESQAMIEQMALLLKQQPLHVFIVGHTDNVGSLESNMALSQARADAVKDALVKQHGVNAAQLTAKGVGPLSPISTNDTDAGKQLNRRVELVKQ